jgi:hypothetical protein
VSFHVVPPICISNLSSVYIKSPLFQLLSAFALSLCASPLYPLQPSFLMIPRNSPLPILRRVCKLPRRQLVLARIRNPLIFSHTFALYHRQPHPHPHPPSLLPLHPNPPKLHLLSHSPKHQHSHPQITKHPKIKIKIQEMEMGVSNPIHPLNTSQPPHPLAPQIRKPWPGRRRSSHTHLMKRAIDARVELPPDLLARAVRRRQHVLREGACFFEFSSGGSGSSAGCCCWGGIGRGGGI